MQYHTRSEVPLSWRARLGYGVGDFGCNFYWQSISLFLYFFYTDVLGIPPLVAGLTFGIASVYDAVADPIMGAIADRSRARGGRYRTYMLLGSVPLAVSFAAMFYVPPMSGAALVVYATLSHVLMRTLYTVVNIPYLALSAAMTSDAGERATLAGVRMACVAIAAVSIAVFLPKTVSALTGQVAQPYFVVAILIGLIAAIAIVSCALSTRETTQPAVSGHVEPFRLRSVARDTSRDFVGFWGMLRHSGPMARVIGVIFVISVALTMFSKCLLYWFKYGLQRPDMAPVALAIPALMLVLCAPLWVWVARRFSKRAAWMAGSLFAAAGYLGFWLNGSTAMSAVLGWIAVVGIGTSCFAITFWAMLPDTVEYNEWALGARNEAKVAGFAVFAQKVALAVNALVLGQVLAWLGFVANQPLGAATLAGIKATMCLAPLAGVTISVLLLWKYPITPAFHRRMVDELAARSPLRSSAGTLTPAAT